MDRNYYYRILGLTEGATVQQVKQAYETRMAKLSSADFRDDPEYAAKKKRQATEAYRVLTGSAPPVSNVQKKARLEKFKDSAEKKEGGQRPFSQSSNNNGTRTYQSRQGGNKKYIVLAIVLVVVIIIAVMGTVLFSVGNLFNDIGSGLRSEGWFGDENDYDYDYESGNTDTIDQVEDEISGYDYYENLDLSAMEDNILNVDLSVGIGDYGGPEEEGSPDVFGNTLDILYTLGIYDASEFFGYISNIEDYYMEYDDFACAEKLISWMGAPMFYDVVGSVNMYTGEPILNMADYLDYLWYVIDENY